MEKFHLAAFEKEETVFFLDELFPELKGKTLIRFCSYGKW